MSLPIPFHSKPDLDGLALPRTTTNRVILLGFAMCLTSILLLVDRGVLQEVSRLYSPETISHSYFVPQHWFKLYIRMPIIVLASILTILAPGTLLVTAFGKAKGVAELVLKGFLLSFLIITVVESTFKVVFGLRMLEGEAVILLLGLAWLSWLLLLYRTLRGSVGLWPIASQHGGRRLAWFLAIPVLIVVFMLPPMFWQDLNPDGVEILLVGRSLGESVLPRIPVESGLVGLGLGMISQAFPVHWFQMIFGLIDVTARLPFLLYIPLIFLALTALIEYGSPTQLDFLQELLLVSSLGVFIVAMGYNDTYHPYSADIASPAALDIMMLLCVLAAVLFLWRKRPFWVLGWVLLLTFARPTGFLILFLLAVGLIITGRHRGQRMRILLVGFLFIGLIYFLYEWIYIPTNLDAVGSMQAPGTSILDRMRYLRFDDVSRFAFLFVPSGILPGLSLFWIRKQDTFSRQLTFVTLAYFVFFFSLAFVALHHFVPVMVLPIVVFWRMMISEKRNRWVLPITGIFILFSLWLSMPRTFHLDRSTRAWARALDYRIGHYTTNYEGVREAFKEKDILYHVFPPHWEVADPSKEWVGSPGQMIHYAESIQDKTSGRVNYIVQSVDLQAPQGFTKIADQGSSALYVRDVPLWTNERSSPPPTNFRSPTYELSRSTMFKSLGVQMGNYDLDLINVLPEEVVQLLLSLRDS